MGKEILITGDIEIESLTAIRLLFFSRMHLSKKY